MEAFLHVRPERLTPHVLYAVVEAALIVLQAGRVELVFPAPLRRLIVSEVYDAYGPVVRRRVVPSALVSGRPVERGPVDRSGVLVDGVAVAVAVSANHAALGVVDDFDVPAFVRLVVFRLTNDVDLVRRLAPLSADQPWHFGPEAAYRCFGRLEGVAAAYGRVGVEWHRLALLGLLREQLDVVHRLGLVVGVLPIRLSGR